MGRAPRRAARAVAGPCGDAPRAHERRCALKNVGHGRRRTVAAPITYGCRRFLAAVRDVRDDLLRRRRLRPQHRCAGFVAGRMDVRTDGHIVGGRGTCMPLRVHMHMHMCMHMHMHMHMCNVNVNVDVGVQACTTCLTVSMRTAAPPRHASAACAAASATGDSLAPTPASPSPSSPPLAITLGYPRLSSSHRLLLHSLSLSPSSPTSVTQLSPTHPPALSIDPRPHAHLHPRPRCLCRGCGALYCARESSTKTRSFSSGCCSCLC